MKHLTTKLFILGIFLFIFDSHAEVYKGLDEEGNVIYADKPFSNSEVISPPSLTIVDAPEVEVKKEIIEEDEKPVAFKYISFSIISPLQDETIWNNPQVTIQLQLHPDLNIELGHNIWLLMDGMPLIKNSSNLSLPVGRLDRGSHTFQALVKSKSGKTVMRTKTITVHIKNTIITQHPKSSGN